MFSMLFGETYALLSKSLRYRHPQGALKKTSQHHEAGCASHTYLFSIILILGHLGALLTLKRLPLPG